MGDAPKRQVMYLGACLDDKQWATCAPNSCNTWCTHAYMLTPEGAKWLLKELPDGYNQVTNNTFLHIMNQPLVGYRFTHDQTERQWRGLFYQARKADWYTPGMNEHM